ncbi:PaaI family thioesterase [Aquabacter sp. CN5-332]|uniref:PaaI family thioesterase n=1 Tax=Aquabacter sp. CN5-332 TaxID=3156608 RepID=UPI0032B38CC9
MSETEAAERPSLATLNERITRGPFHRWLGLSVVEAGDGEIVVECPWREEMVVNPDAGYTHGGILATLVDLVADWALATTKLGRPFPTVDLRVDYHRPAMKGTLKVRGKVVRLGSTFSTCEAYVEDADGKLIASGRGTYATTTK